jgi:voltage-gated potassium channel
MPEHPALGDLHPDISGDASQRRRLIAGLALRIAATTAGLLVIYAFVPVPGTSGAGAFVGMLVGLGGFMVLVAWQLRAIAQARYPLMRALQLIALALPLLAVVFAFTYLSISRADPESFTEPLDRVAAMYYTVSTISTVGFGDISAQSDAARILVTVQMLFDLALIAGLVRLIVLATRTGLQRRNVAVGGGDAPG